MRPTTIHRRMPRAGHDPIDTPAAALSVVSLVMHRPARHETILLLLDDARRGQAIVVVSGTAHPDAVIEVVEFVTQAIDERIAAVVVASCRPDGDDGAEADDEADDGALDGDVDRWLEMSEIAALAGLEVVEWFVIGRSIGCPRDRLGEPPRW